MQLLLLPCVLGLALGVALGAPTAHQNGHRTCGYESCNQHEPNMLNVHLVAHTHDDVGWLKTIDQYYYGTRNNIQHAGVKYILDSVVKELWADPNRRFIYVESFFFFKWWSHQSDDTKRKVHTLVEEGRLQFAGGAWSMNDEAAAHYHSTIDQFTHGLRQLNDTFGACGLPTVGWQIDPFGHSREFASLLALMGYDGLFLGRIDYQDKAHRMNHTTMEMLWKGDSDIGKASDIFTGVLYNMYQPPPGFCFDIFCSDLPIVEDTSSPEYNLDSRVSEFLQFVANARSAYGTSNILVTMGDDFNYQDAASWFTNLDKLITYTNIRAAKKGLNIKLFYSTPQCYLKAVKDANPVLPTKSDDFFPYASEPTNYWTGYYTSRPTTKYFERETNGYLQMAKQLQAVAGLEEHNMFMLDELKGAMGIMQHHDAITGTEKQHVAHDYERLLNNAIEDSLLIPRQAFNKFMQGDATKLPIFTYDRCHLNESSCHTSENSQQFVVTIYNHLAWQVNEPIRIPVTDGEYEVYAPNGDKITSQLAAIPAAVVSIPTRRSAATHEVVFIAYLHPLSYKSFYIRRVDNKLDALNLQSRHSPDAGDQNATSEDEAVGTEGFPDGVVLDNKKISLSTNLSKGQIFTATVQNTTVKFKLEFGMYQTVKSGAYIFRPNSATPQPFQHEFIQGPTGPVFSEIIIKTKENTNSAIRIYEGLDYVEHDWVVGPIVIDNKIGKEYIVRYSTDLLNHGEFYTDSNGRQMLKRKLNYRPQWNVTLAEPVAGNYYPIVNKISIQDDNTRVSVLTDRSEGGSSLEEGQIEVMLHRRLVNDDYKGVGEALNETVLNGIGLVVRGRHRLFISDIADNDRNIKEKKTTIELDLQPQIFVSDAKDLSLESWLKLKNCYIWANALPDGLNLLTLEPWKDKTILLRLENYLERSYNVNSTIEIDMRSIFKTLALKSVKETTLGANRWLDNFKQWSWNTDDGENLNNKDGGASVSDSTKKDGDEFVIKIKAKEIRTFVIEYDINK